jgi:hypothetical protein
MPVIAAPSGSSKTRLPELFVNVNTWSDTVLSQFFEPKGVYARILILELHLAAALFDTE